MRWTVTLREGSPPARVHCRRLWSGTWQPSCWSCSTSSTQSPWPSPLKPWKRQTFKNGEGEHTSADSPKTGIEVRLFRRWVRFDKWQTSHVHCSGVYDLHCVCDTFAQTTLVAFLVVSSRPLMVEWYIWKVGWFRVFGCSSSRGASALPQITILALTSLFKTDISLHPLEQQCMQTNKNQKKAVKIVLLFLA